ncbi:MAG: radical SAM protein [Candidatus Omnitrophota bacterium]
MIRKARKLVDHISIVLRSGVLRAAPVSFPLFEIEPTSCNIMVTNRCNLKCLMCKQWRESPGEELSTADWIKIIDDLRKNGFRNIHFTGGEPLLRADLKDLVAYCDRNGFTVGMTTNGMLLDGDMLDGLIASGLRSVALSMDALGGQYEKIRGASGSFEKAQGASAAIAEAKNRGRIDAYINFTLMKENIDLFKDVDEFARSIGLPVAICLLDKTSAIFDLKENDQRYWISSPEDMKRLTALLEYLKGEIARKPRSIILNYPGVDYIAAYFQDPRQAGIPCTISQDRIYIDPYGNLFGGCLSMGTFGSLKDIPFGRLKEIGRYREAKKKMFYKKCPGCSCGYLYNIRCLPGAIVRDLASGVRYSVFKRPRYE